GDAVAVQQRLAELVLDVQVGGGGEDEVGNLIALVPELVDDAHGRVDVAFGRAHHAHDLQVGPDLAALSPAEHQSQRLALAFGDRREADVHHVDTDVRQLARQRILVPG